MKNKIMKTVSLIALSMSIFACEALKETLGVPNRSPVIASFDYNPKSGITKNDVVTFSVVANDPEGKPLQYNWTSTKGTLTGNAGSTISWRPFKQDASFETGLSNVSLIVSDGIMTTTASVNIFVMPEGVISIDSNPIINKSPVPSASATPTPSPSPSVTTSPTPSSSPSPSSTPSTSPSVTPSATATPVVSPSPSPTATSSASPSVVASPVPSSHSTVIVSKDN